MIDDSLDLPADPEIDALVARAFDAPEPTEEQCARLTRRVWPMIRAFHRRDRMRRWAKGLAAAACLAVTTTVAAGTAWYVSRVALVERRGPLLGVEHSGGGPGGAAAPAVSLGTGAGVAGDEAPIVVVLVDKATLAALGVEELPRKAYAALVDRLASARVIAFDVAFPPADDPEGTMRLAEAMRRHGRVVLGAWLDTAPREGAAWPAEFALARGAPPAKAPRMGGADLPDSRLLEAAAGLGAFNIAEADVFNSRGRVVPGLPVVARTASDGTGPGRPRQVFGLGPESPDGLQRVDVVPIASVFEPGVAERLAAGTVYVGVGGDGTEGETATRTVTLAMRQGGI